MWWEPPKKQKEVSTSQKSFSVAVGNNRLVYYGPVDQSKEWVEIARFETKEEAQACADALKKVELCLDPDGAAPNLPVRVEAVKADSEPACSNGTCSGNPEPLWCWGCKYYPFWVVNKEGKRGLTLDVWSYLLPRISGVDIKVFYEYLIDTQNWEKGQK